MNGNCNRKRTANCLEINAITLPRAVEKGMILINDGE